MTFSPLQQDYVTKAEFSDFRSEVNDRFDRIDSKFVTWKDEIINTLTDEFSRQTGIIIETFQHNLKASMEYMDSRLDKKLDKSEFYEYLELHFPKQTKMPYKHK